MLSIIVRGGLRFLNMGKGRPKAPVCDALFFWNARQVKWWYTFWCLAVHSPLLGKKFAGEIAFRPLGLGKVPKKGETLQLSVP